MASSALHITDGIRSIPTPEQHHLPLRADSAVQLPSGFTRLPRQHMLKLRDPYEMRLRIMYVTKVGAFVLWFCSSLLLLAGCGSSYPPYNGPPPITYPPLNTSEFITSVIPAIPASPAATAQATCATVVADGPVKDLPVGEMVNLLRGKALAKGEFETTPEWQARLAGIVAQVTKLAQARYGHDEIRVLLPIPEARIRYDADMERLRIGEDSGLLITQMAGATGVVLTASNEKATGTYIGSNAYGAKRTIVKLAGTAVGVALDDSDSLGWPRNFKPITVTMTPAEARAAKPNLAVLVVGTLAPPLLRIGEISHAPTIDYAVERHIATEAVMLHLDCAVVYDRKGDRIVADIPTASLPR